MHSRIIEFYFSDLTEDAQNRYLEAHGLKDAAEGNLDMDVFPIFEVEVDD